ncbi:Zn-ribbon domain-containing OB-fold protein [Bacillus timonensis]|uniref:Zn-ribbon domain-containing OB-fold protein n=1 Tax=Bacillus timonensis TaxID=1033734 RepID=UPI00028895C2|nr:Zn-ribbon domain-containing OB-fold protein [Bacillus timonensis]
MIEKFENLTVPGPTVTPFTKPFWDAVARQEFILQKCKDCGEWVFYPRSHCPHCLSNQLEWTPASGKGKLKTWSIVHRPGHPAWAAVAPYALGVVELEEGPTMLTHLLVDPNQEFKIGLPLKVKYIKINEEWLPFFESIE